MSNEKEYNDTMLISARTNDTKDNSKPLHYKDTNFVFIGYDSREDIAYSCLLYTSPSPRDS